MAEDFNFADSPEFVWVDLPGSEFADSSGTSNIIRLAYPAAVNMSTIYKCLMVRGGRVLNINSAVGTIRIGHGSTFIVQLQAERVDTGETMIFTPQQMADIEQIKLCLEPGKAIASNDTGVGLGTDKPFDHTIAPDSAKLAITIGATDQIKTMAGEYDNTHLDVYFKGKTDPVPCEFFPILVLPDD